MIFTEINPQEFVQNHKEDILLFIKDVHVNARIAKEGETISTIMKDGHVETKNIAKSNQVVIKNPDGEEYIIDREKFEKRYDTNSVKMTGDYQSFKANGGPVEVIRLNQNENVSFIAPWGEKMEIKGGGVIVNGGPNDIYGIQPEEFQNTYKPCDQNGVILYDTNSYGNPRPNREREKNIYFSILNKNNPDFKM
jgi:hypothetical protein